MEACSWTAHVWLSEFPAPTRHTPDRYPDRYPEIDFWTPGYTNTHSKPREENEVVRKFHAQAKAWKGEPLRLADMIWYIYIYNWIFNVSTGSGCSTSTKPLRKTPLPNYSERCTSFCKETINQPQPQGLNPNQQAKVTAWHTKPCKLIQRTPKTDTFLHKTGFCCIAFCRSPICICIQDNHVPSTYQS